MDDRLLSFRAAVAVSVHKLQPTASGRKKSKIRKIGNIRLVVTCGDLIINLALKMTEIIFPVGSKSN